MASIREHRKGKHTAQRDSRGPSSIRLSLLAAGFAVLLVVGVALYFKGKAIHVPVNAETLCPTDQAPTQLVVLLLDMSDAYTEAQRLQISNELLRIQQDVAKFGRIEVYTVDRIGERVARPALQLCNPGTERDVNAIYQNPRLAKERWLAFSSQLEGELSRLMETDKSDTSPIFEAIQSTALRTFNRPEYDGVPRRLVVASDLLQHVPGRLSHYQTQAPFAEFATSAYLADVRADLSGTDVTLLYLMRPGTPQGPGHLLFWERYFDVQGASIAAVVPIYGAQ